MAGAVGTGTVGGDKGARGLNTFLDKLNIFEKKKPSEGSQIDHRDGDSGPAQPAETAPSQPSGHYEQNGRPLGSDELPNKGSQWVPNGSNGGNN